MYGDGLIWRIPGGILALIMSTTIFIPLLHRLKLYSIFDYFKLRFDSAGLTNITIGIGLLGLLFHMMGLSYLTALSLSTITNIGVLPSLVMLNSIAILYTMLGTDLHLKIYFMLP